VTPRRRYGPWVALIALIVVVDAILLVFAHPAIRACLSFTVSGVVAGLLFTATIAAVRAGGRLMPAAALVAALAGYALTVVILGAAFLLLSPRVIERWAVAAGLLSVVLIWTTEAIRSSGTRVNEC
jgi:ABC-type Co2+ transport system permease subunit